MSYKNTKDKPLTTTPRIKIEERLLDNLSFVAISRHFDKGDMLYILPIFDFPYIHFLRYSFNTSTIRL